MPAVFSCITAIWLSGFLTPVPQLDVNRLVSEADIIVVGVADRPIPIGISGVDIGGTRVPAELMRTTVRVDTVLKGSVQSPELALEFVHPDQPVGYPGFPNSVPRVFFLRSEQGHYGLASPYHPTLEAGPVAPLVVGDPIRGVVSALAAALRAPDATLQSKSEAVFELGAVQDPSAVEALRPVVQDADVDLRIAAMAALLKLGDSSVVPLVARVLGDDRTLPDSRERLDDSLAGAKVDATAIPSLTDMLQSADVGTRRASARALRRVSSPATVPALALGLSDTDNDVLFSVTAGLAEITGDSKHIVTRGRFEARREDELEYWRTWARIRGLIK